MPSLRRKASKKPSPRTKGMWTLHLPGSSAKLVSSSIDEIVAFTRDPSLLARHLRRAQLQHVEFRAAKSSNDASEYVEGLTGNEEVVDEFIRKNGTASQKDITNATGVPSGSLSRSIKGLKRKRGLLSKPYRYAVQADNR